MHRYHFWGSGDPIKCFFLRESTGGFGPHFSYLCIRSISVVIPHIIGHSRVNLYPISPMARSRWETTLVPCARGKDDLADFCLPHIHASEVAFTSDVTRLLDRAILFVIAVGTAETYPIFEENVRGKGGHAVPTRENLKGQQGDETVMIFGIRWQWNGYRLFVKATFIMEVFDQSIVFIPRATQNNLFCRNQ